jgi:ABC-type cobalamin/Fe3+-siderophores transport system ATPase subunit
VIRYEDVVVRYPRASRDALAGVRLDAPRGRVTAVVGPNGSGKSTLVRALLRRVPLAAGSLLVDGAPLARFDRAAIARRVAVVTQRETLAFPVTVEEYVALGRFPHLGGWRAAGSDDRGAVVNALERAGVETLASRTIDHLSGGEWQRVRLARALAQGGEALVLDEPTTFLDIAHEMSVFELLHQLAREGRAVLLVSHQLNLVARFADWIVLLHEGHVAATGTPDDVMQASVLERVYEWPLVVTRDPAVGAPALLPLRAGRRDKTRDTRPET